MDLELPCIRCGACAVACPEQLQPQQLWLQLRAGDPAQADALGLPHCNGCGACDTACPSRISLRSVLLDGQAALREQAQRHAVALAARTRFEQRASRLKRDSGERAEREALMSKQATSVDAVAAAIERAKARRTRPGSPP